MTTALQLTKTLEALVQVADDVFIVCDAGATIRFVNPAAKKLFGYEPE